MTTITFDQFQDKLEKAKMRVAESRTQLDAIINTANSNPINLASIDEQVKIDTEELKKIEQEMGAELNEAFIELAQGDDVPDADEVVPDESAKVENTD